MTTLILSPRYTPDSNALWKAALDSGWSVERLQTHRPPEHLRDKQPVIYGEGIFANIVADELRLALLEPPFDFLSHLPEHYLLRDIRFSNLKDARKLNVPQFIKPAYDKSFEARVYDSGESLLSPDILPDELPVLVAEPVSWEIEFRCFILERQVATQSVYLIGGELARDETGMWLNTIDEQNGALQFVNTLLIDSIVRMPPAFVLDVGYVKDRGWAVIEANPAWASGIYGCDPQAVLGVLERTCVKTENLTDDDKNWLFDRSF